MGRTPGVVWHTFCRRECVYISWYETFVNPTRSRAGLSNNMIYMWRKLEAVINHNAQVFELFHITWGDIIYTQIETAG